MILDYIETIFGKILISVKILNSCNLESFVNGKQELWGVAENHDANSLQACLTRVLNMSILPRSLTKLF